MDFTKGYPTLEQYIPSFPKDCKLPTIADTLPSYSNPLDTLRWQYWYLNAILVFAESDIMISQWDKTPESIEQYIAIRRVAFLREYVAGKAYAIERLNRLLSTH